MRRMLKPSEQKFVAKEATIGEDFTLGSIHMYLHNLGFKREGQQDYVISIWLPTAKPYTKTTLGNLVRGGLSLAEYVNENRFIQGSVANELKYFIASFDSTDGVFTYEEAEWAKIDNFHEDIITAVK